MLREKDHTLQPHGPASLEIIVDGESHRSAVTVLANDDARWIQISRTV